MRITRNMKIDGPRQAVFNTAELLEAILLEIPMKQLFTIRRVSKQFRDTVNSSVRLQEEMFLRPRKTDKEFWTLRTLQPYPDGFRKSQMECEFVPSSELVTNQVANAERMQPVRCNPMVCEHRNGSMRTPVRTLYSQYEVIDLSLKPLLIHPDMCPEMYLTDPPCTETFVELEIPIKTKPRVFIYTKEDIKISHPEGVTARHISQALMQDSHEFLVWSDGATELHMSSLDALLDKVCAKESKLQIIEQFRKRFEYARLPGIILPTEAEREEVRRKSIATSIVL